MSTRTLAGLALCLLASLALITMTLAGAPPLSAQPSPDAPTPTPTLAPPPVPTIVAPLDSATTTGTSNAPAGMPTFMWEVPVIAPFFHLQVSDSPGFSTLLVDKTTNAKSYTPTDIWPNGTYYWRVMAGNGSTSLPNWGPYTLTYSFTKDWSDIKSIKPSLISPEEGAIRETFQTSDFSWTAVPGAAAYRLEISGDPLFTNFAYFAETIKPQHTPDKRLASNLYYWRVIPFAHQSTSFGRVSGEPSETRQFIISRSTMPRLLAPLNDQDPESIVELAFAPRFQWTAVEGAKEYELEVSTDVNFNPSATYQTHNTDYTPTDALADDQEYFWRVKALDYGDHATAWSLVGRFRIQWNFPPKLLTPKNNQLSLSYPFFSWEPIPGVEYYEIQIDDANAFTDSPIATAKVFNATFYTNPTYDWSNLRIDGDYYWRVRGVDAQNHTTPWSPTYSFRTSYTVSSGPIYPPYYYKPDATNLPVRKDGSIAWPLFVWDTAHKTVTWPPSTSENIQITLGPDYYQLDVDETPAFAAPKFTIQTLGLAAAPTIEHPFLAISSGMEYYWRVRALRDGAQLGYDIIWKMRYDPTKQDLPFSATSIPEPIYPATASEAIGTPPVLGWLPVTGAGNYHVQISRTPDFASIVDEAHPQFVNYVPWQGKLANVPTFGTFWWRVRAESAVDQPAGDWSQPRSFNLSYDLVTGNPFDFVPPGAGSSLPLATSILSDTGKYSSTVTYVATSTGAQTGYYSLGDLHVMLDRTYENGALHWVIAFGVAGATTTPVRYGIYVDIDHRLDSGATADPLKNPIATDNMHRPEYAIYVDRNGDTITAAKYYSWQAVNGQWLLQNDQSLKSQGGWAWYAPDTQAIQLLVPYTALGGNGTASSGSMALAVFSTSHTDPGTMQDSIPPQSIIATTPASTIDNPAFVSDMLMPLYPFDTPLGSALWFEDLPALRWRTPIFDSVDGYQVAVARDVNFSGQTPYDSWEAFEPQSRSFFALLPASFHSQKAYADNESYYWHVRIRHERYDFASAPDYGPWSLPMRFKLDSRMAGNPRISTGPNVFMTPTFEWDRVEGAAGYTIQIDDDAKFSSPLINQATDSTSYTPPETTSAMALLSSTQYYWRVAMRRSDTVLGRWTDPLPFVKTSVAPTPLGPLTTDPLTLVTTQPTFQWSVVLTPTDTPRLATPRYRIQVADDVTFASPFIDATTEATLYTPPKGKSLADREWFWRVAIYEASGKTGPYSAPQKFVKQYPLPALLWPPQNGVSGLVPPFIWQSVPGAAYYRLEIANNDNFQGATSTETPNTSFTPLDKIANGVYYWRVRMLDADRVAGPVVSGKYNLGYGMFLPIVKK